MVSSSGRLLSGSTLAVLIALAFTFSFADTTFAQSGTPKWGKIPAEHLAMTSFDEDPLASVVVLADYGEVTFNRDFDMELRVHRRIKILNESGYDWGTVGVAYNRKRSRLKKFEGQTIVPNGDGSFEKLKVDKKSIFDEQISGDLHRRKMTLPGLAPGVIIEYRYTVRREFDGSVPSWEFQSSEPVLWSEYIAELPSVFAFVTALRGSMKYDIAESKKTNPNGLQSERHRWVMKNLPALREEPYMTTLSDYSVRLTLQMSGYYDPSVGTVSSLSTWEELGKDLMDDADFGRRLKPSSKIKSTVESITEGQSGNAKIAAIHNYIRENVSWDGTDGFYSKGSLDKILEDGSGDSGEINLLLVSMLRAAGFDAHPMLISTRENGQTVETYPILDQFDYVLAYIDYGQKGLSLDATSTYHPYMLLPEHTLNRRGLVIKKKPKWRDIVTEAESKSNLVIRGSLNEDGSIDAKLQYATQGYAAADLRASTEDESLSEILKTEVLVDSPNLSVSEAEVITDSLNRHMARATVSIQDHAIDGGDYMYLNPFVAFTLGENPFKSEVRRFPVDFAYIFEDSFTLELKLPEGFEVAELPEKRIASAGSRKGSYSQIAEAHGDVVRFVCRMKIAEPVFYAREYDDLRQFYNNIVAAEQDQIVLQRVEG